MSGVCILTKVASSLKFRGTTCMLGIAQSGFNMHAKMTAVLIFFDEQTENKERG